MATPFDVGQSQVGGDDHVGGAAVLAAGLPRSPGVGYLVECDTGLRILEWAAASGVTLDSTSVFLDSTSVLLSGSAGVFAAALDKGIRCIDGVTENGVALAAAASVAAVDATAGSWYWEGATGQLWIHTSDSGPASSKVLIATVVECYKFGPGASVFLRNGTPQVYLGRLLAVPGVTLALEGEELSGAITAAFGSLTLANHDGYYSGDADEGHAGLLAERLWAGRAMRVYRGAMDATDRDALTLWVAATMEAAACRGEECTVALTSLAQVFQKPLCRTTFEVAVYPTMDAALAGRSIPRVYGPITQAQAFRIASGRWKVADHAVASIANPLTANGTTVTGFAADVATGEFTCSAAFNTETVLYVDVVGRASTGLPGTLLSRIARDTPGVSSANVDATALDQLDADRPVVLGFQALDGSVQDALDRVAASALCDWYVGRTNLLGGRARARAAGNLVANPGFEVDASGWTGQQAAVIARTTTYHAEGVASLQITKDAANGLGHARTLPRRPVVAGSRYAITALVALAPGSPPTDACVLALVDGAGTEDRSDPFSLEPNVWQRITFVSQGVAVAGVTVDLSTITLDRTDITLDMAEAELRIYPQLGGGGAVVLLVDAVEWVETIAIDGSMADVEAFAPEPTILDLIRVRYGVDGRTGALSYASAEDVSLDMLYPATESRTIEGDVVSAVDAAIVAAAALDYYGHTRGRLALTVFGIPDVPLTQDHVIDLRHRRVPAIVNHAGLWRLLALRESQATASQVPTLELELVAHYDPAADRPPVA